MGSIREKLFRLLEGKPFVNRVDRVMLITSARYVNYVFNPVSFYYCLGNDGGIVCVVAEVNNTFGEKHLYILHEVDGQAEGYAARYVMDKAFHVSPFNNLEGQYEFLFTKIKKEIDIRIRLHRNNEMVFEGELFGRSVPLTPANHARMLLKHPILPHLSIPRILFEAVRLKFQKKLDHFTKPIPMSAMTIRIPPPGTFQKICMKLIFSFLGKITHGGITVYLPNNKVMHFGDRLSPIQGDITIHDYRFFSDIVLDGDIGLGEAYMDGAWDTRDLPGLFGVFIKNRDALGNGYPATAWIVRQKNKLFHFLRANTLMGSRKNIRSHYDLSNDFFRLFLDPSMTYSCGIYLSEQDSLEVAQMNKLMSMIRKAQIQGTHHLLEIGCGWGSLAVMAAKETGCRVTGVTVSDAQHRFATERVSREGLQDKIAISLTDYRKVQGLYDAIVSVEMLEAVGEEYLGAFFSCCDRLLKPGGRAVIQTITIPDERYEQYRKETDWIQKHIFPGGFIPSVQAIREVVAKNTTLVEENIEEIGPHYATTLREWRNRFNENIHQVSSMGFDREFQRKWVYYLAYCEAGFAEHALGDIEIVFRKPK
jgi:cyclopropane-fatty-acyl-phospholipid synthase